MTKKITGTIFATNISAKKGTAKKNVSEITIDECGVVNDAHRTYGHRQVSIMNKESIEAFVKRTGKQINFGDFGENLTVSGIELKNVQILDQFKINDVLLRVTQVGKECHGNVCEIFRAVGKCIMPQEGIFCRVIKGGKIKVDDVIEYLPKTLKILLITLSDRASSGEYQDKSGERAEEILNTFFATQKYRFEIARKLLKDDENLLTRTLQTALKNEVDIIFTLGGTGISPRDIAPETVAKFCQKIIPGVMENIRLKYAEKNPASLLSRSIAGINNNTQIYALPGSVKAVEEYLTEIIKTLNHAILMMYGVGH